MRYKKIALILATALCLGVLSSCKSKEASSDQVAEESAETSLDEESTLSESNNPDTDSDESKLQDRETEDGDATETAESENKEPTDTTDEKETSDMTQDKIVELPPSGYDKKRPGVTYPEFKTYTYYSNTAERDTNMNVLLPVDYSEDKEYPVLYILHGFFDDETWMARDVVAIPEIFTRPGPGHTAPTYPKYSGCLKAMKSDSRPPMENPVIAVFSLSFETLNVLSTKGLTSVTKSLIKLSYA